GAWLALPRELWTHAKPAMSCSAKAEHPVITGRSENGQAHHTVNTGSPACAGDDRLGTLKTSLGLSCGTGPHTLGQRHRLVGALHKLDGHEHQLVIADVFQIVHLELPATITLVARFARRIGVFHGGAVVHVLPAAPAVHACPEIIEYVA